MQYHWGQGIGHLHAHQCSSQCIPKSTVAIDALDDPGTDELPSSEALATNAADMDDIDDKLDNPEFSLRDYDVEGWEDVESDTADNDGLDLESEDDDRAIYE